MVSGGCDTMTAPDRLTADRLSTLPLPSQLELLPPRARACAPHIQPHTSSLFPAARSPCCSFAPTTGASLPPQLFHTEHTHRTHPTPPCRPPSCTPLPRSVAPAACSLCPAASPPAPAPDTPPCAVTRTHYLVLELVGVALVEGDGLLPVHRAREDGVGETHTPVQAAAYRHGRQLRHRTRLWFVGSSIPVRAIHGISGVLHGISHRGSCIASAVTR